MISHYIWSTFFQIIFCYPMKMPYATLFCSFTSYTPWIKRDISLASRGRKRILPYPF